MAIVDDLDIDPAGRRVASAGRDFTVKLLIQSNEHLAQASLGMRTQDLVARTFRFLAFRWRPVRDGCFLSRVTGRRNAIPTGLKIALLKMP